MNINQVAYFAEAVERGSLSAAAKEQFVTVQAVSKAITDLEAELDCALLVRESRGVHPTAFGEVFYQKALKALASFKDLELFTQTYNTSADRKGELLIGLNTPPFFGNEQIRGTIVSLIESQVGVSAAVPLVTGEKGLEELRAGSIDALITVGMFNYQDVTCSVVGTVSSAVMMRRNHPLADNDIVTLADLVPYPIANPNWFSSFNDSMVAHYKDRDIALRFVDIEMKGVQDHLKHDGLILTVGLEVLEKLDPGIALRRIATKDAVAMPICFVSMSNHMSQALFMLQKLVSEWMGLLNGGCIKPDHT